MPRQYTAQVAQAGKARVAGVAARVAGVDLLDDHRNLEQAESVDEERVLNRATDMLFVSRDQFAPGQVPFAAAGMDAESGVLY